MYLERISLNLEKEKGLGYNWDAVNMSERTLEINVELCACLIEWQKAFDHVKWTKLMQILKETSIEWCERRLTSKLYMDQSVEDWIKGRQEM
jgi:hypothetical protein